MFALAAFNGCSIDDYSKNELCDSLEKDYRANIDFIISTGRKSTSGKAVVTKGDKTELVFSEPEMYKEISVICDETGSPDVFSFEYSGIPANVPKSIVSELSIMFSLFSDDVVAAVLDAPKDDFSRLDDKTNEIFLDNDAKLRITYNSKTGIPNLVETERDGISVSIKILDYQTI